MNSSLHHIKNQLRQYKKKYFLNRIIRGVIFCTSLLLLTFLLINGLEYMLYLSSPVKISILSFSGVLGLLTLGYWVVYPSYQLYKNERYLSDEEAAEQIGKYFTEIDDKLLNIIQLSKLESKENELILASINQKAKALSVIPFVQSIDLKRNTRHLPYLYWPLGFALLLLLLIPQFYTEGTARIIDYKTSYQPQAPFQFLLLSELRAFKNDDYEIQIRIEGQSIPSELFLVMENREIPLSKNKSGVYTYTLSKIQNSEEFSLSAAGFRSENYRVQVVERPDIKSFNIIAEYPPYLRKSPEKFSNTGNLEVPEGTLLTWQIQAPTADSVHITFPDAHLGLIKQNESFNGSLKAENTSPYEIGLVNEYSTNKKPIEYRLSVVKDEYPQLEVEQYQDTSLFSFIMLGGNISDDHGLSRFVLQYSYTDKTGQSLQKQETIPFNDKSSNQSFLYQWNLPAAEIQEGSALEYYLEVWDNDGVNGRKSTKSTRFSFKIPSEDERSEMAEKTSQAAQSQLDKTLDKAKKLEESIKEITERLKGKKDVNYQEEKILQELLKKRKELDEEIARLKALNEDLKEKNEALGTQSEELQKKAEELKKLMDEVLDEETRKLYEELQRLLEEKADINQIQNQLEKISKKENNLEKELERSIELFKRMKFDQALEQNIQALEKLENQQKELNQKTEKASKEEMQALSEEQKQLEREFEEWQKEQDKLKDLNQDLKNPNSLPDTKEEEESIQQELKNSSESLQEQKQKDAKQSQKKAAEQMQQLKEQMQQMQSSMQMESLSENLDNLRDIVDNLVKLSMRQENLMKSIREINPSDPRFVDLSQQQLFLQNDTQIVKDSLESLAQRVFQIQSFITRELSDLDQYLSESTEALRERNKGTANVKQQFAMSSYNNLALLLDEVLQQMQQQMADAMGNPQKGNKKKQATPSMSQLQQQLNQKIQDLQKNGQSGRQLSEQLAEMAAEQERIREMLRELNEKSGGKDGLGGNPEEIMRKMEQTENDLVNKRITPQTIKRQQEILTRLLETEKAEKERELDKERKAETAKQQNKDLPPAFEKYIESKKKELEMYKTVPPKLSPYYKKEVNNYFKRINQ